MDIASSEVGAQLTLDVQFQTNLPPPPILPLQIITNQLKENNPKMTIVWY